MRCEGMFVVKKSSGGKHDKVHCFNNNNSMCHDK